MAKVNPEAARISALSRSSQGRDSTALAELPGERVTVQACEKRKNGYRLRTATQTLGMHDVASGARYRCH